MSGLYGVTPSDISNELPGLFPVGFSVSTKPSAATVQALIDAADTIAQLEVTEAIGKEPNSFSPGAVLAVKYVKEQVKAQIIRMIYAGNDPRDLNAATAPYDQIAETYRAAIQRLGTQGSQEPGVPVARVRGQTSQRDLLFEDTSLGSFTRPATGGARPL